MRKAGIASLTLEPIEGLALFNGTQAMTATGGLALAIAQHLVEAADEIGAPSLEALKGTPTAFDEKIHAVRPHPGQSASAERMRALMEESEIRESHWRLIMLRLPGPFSERFLNDAPNATSILPCQACQPFCRPNPAPIPD